MAPTAAQNSLLFAIFLFLSVGDSAVAQGLLPPAGLFGTGSHVCTYQYAIPSGQRCDLYGAGLEGRFRSTRQELDDFQQQFVTQNTQLIEILRQLRQQTSTTDTEVSDITKDFKTLQATVDSLQARVLLPNNNNKGGSGLGGGSSGVSDVIIEQLVTSTRQQMTQDMAKLRHDLNSTLSAVTGDRQAASIQQSTVDSAFQVELRQQQQDLTNVIQQLQQLQAQLAPLLTPHPPPPRVGGEGVEGVRELLRGLSGRLADVEDALRTGLPVVRDNLTLLQNTLTQQRKDEVRISDLSLQLGLLASRLSSVIRQQGLTSAPHPSTTAPTTTPVHVPNPRAQH